MRGAKIEKIMLSAVGGAHKGYIRYRTFFVAGHFGTRTTGAELGRQYQTISNGGPSGSEYIETK